MKMKKIRYPNATRIKLKNKRVTVTTLKDKNYCIEFLKVAPKDELINPLYHIVLKGKVVCTSLCLTPEAALALYTCLKNELSKSLNPVPPLKGDLFFKLKPNE